MLIYLQLIHARVIHQGARVYPMACWLVHVLNMLPIPVLLFITIRMLLCIKAKSANSTNANAWALVLSSSPNPCQHGPAAGLDSYAKV